MATEPFSPDELSRYATVVTWIARLPNIPTARQRHLQVLARFCAAEEADPDTLIARGLASRDEKLEAMRRLNRWVTTQESTERAQHEIQNSVRSFYLCNGVRVVTKPFPDVYRRAPAT